MKMNNYRLFLLGFVMASWLLLTGFQQPGVGRAFSPQKQAASAKADDKARPVALNRKVTKNRRSRAESVKDAQPEKSLDLTIPFKVTEGAWQKAGQDRISKREPSLFGAEKEKYRPVDLEGEMLMSQEPEADKRKSLDGAGVVITLKQ